MARSLKYRSTGLRSQSNLEKYQDGALRSAAAMCALMDQEESGTEAGDIGPLELCAIHGDNCG